MPENKTGRARLLEGPFEPSSLHLLHGPAGTGKSTLLALLKEAQPDLVCVDDADRLDPETLENMLEGGQERPIVAAVRTFPEGLLRQAMYRFKVHVWTLEDLLLDLQESLHWGEQLGFEASAIQQAHDTWMGWVFPMLLELQGNTVLLEHFLQNEVIGDHTDLFDLSLLPEVTPALASYLLGEERARRVLDGVWHLQRLFLGSRETGRWIPGLRRHLQQQALPTSAPAFLQEVLRLMVEGQQFREALELVQQHFTPEGTVGWLHQHLETLLLAGLGEEVHQRFQFLLGEPLQGDLEIKQMVVRSYLAFFGGTPYRASVGELRHLLSCTANLHLQAELHALLAWWTPDPVQGSLSRAQVEAHMPLDRPFFRHIARVSLGRETSRSAGFEAAGVYFQDLLDETLQNGQVCASLLTLLMQAHSEVHHLKLRRAGRTLRHLFELSVRFPEHCRPLVAHARLLHAQVGLLGLQATEALESAVLCRTWAEKTFHQQLLQGSADAMVLSRHLLGLEGEVPAETTSSMQAQMLLLRGRPLQVLEKLPLTGDFLSRLLQVRAHLDLGDHQRGQNLLSDLHAGSITEHLMLLATRTDLLVRLKKLSEARIAARAYWETVQHEPVFLPLLGLGEAALLLFQREARKQGIVLDMPLERLMVTPSPLLDLSDRERTLLQFLSAGQSNPEMAERLGISVNTVKYHLKHLYEKLGVRTREAARDLGQKVLTRVHGS